MTDKYSGGSKSNFKDRYYKEDPAVDPAPPHKERREESAGDAGDDAKDD